LGESCKKGLLHAKQLLQQSQSAGVISQNGTCSDLPGGAHVRCCMDIGGCNTGDEGGDNGGGDNGGG